MSCNWPRKTKIYSAFETFFEMTEKKKIKVKINEIIKIGSEII